MGGHYGSVQVRGLERERVKAIASEAARERGVKCLVGPTLGEWVGVYPEGNGQDDAFGAALAGKVAEDVLHLLVHDDSILAYRFYREGKLVDSYWSAPGYFGEENRESEEAMRGEPEVFRHVIGDGVKKLGAVLSRENRPAFESESLEKLAKALKIANGVTAYEYLKEEDGREGIKGWGKFEEVPEAEVVAEKKAKARATDEVSGERKRLREAGLLLLRDERKDLVCRGTASALGFVVAWPNHMGKNSFSTYRAPWKGEEELALATSAHVTEISSNASGTRIAIAGGDRVSVFDARREGWQHVADIAESDLAVEVDTSADGGLVAHLSRKELVVTAVAGAKRMLAVAAEGDRKLAIHPSGEWFAMAGNEFSLVSLNGAPHVRKLWLGGRTEASPLIKAALAEKLKWEGSPDVEKMVEGAVSKLRAMFGKKGMPAASEEELAKMEKQMRENMAAAMAMKEKLQREGPPARPAEQAMTVGFSADGRLMWCGTAGGVRVYEWAKVPREEGAELVSPLWRYDGTHQAERGASNYVYSIAEEPGGGGIVFGGTAGRVYRMDLASGEVREILALPGTPWVQTVAISTDGNVLGVASMTDPIANRSGRGRAGAWEVWDYAKMLRG